MRELFGAKSAEFVDPRVDVEEALSEITRDRGGGADVFTANFGFDGLFW